MEWAAIGLGVTCVFLLVGWQLDHWNYRQQIAQRDRQLERTCRVLSMMTLAGAVTDRHQFVGMQQLVKMQAVPTGDVLEPEPVVRPPPAESEGLVVRGSFAQ